MNDTEMLLTEAVNTTGYIIVRDNGMGAASSNARKIPYAEVYRQHTGLYETPIQNVQRAADDEAARAGVDVY